MKNNKDLYVGFRVSLEEKNAIERARKEFNSDSNFSEFLRLATFEFVDRVKTKKNTNPILEKLKKPLAEINKIIKLEEKNKIIDLIDQINES